MISFPISKRPVEEHVFELHVDTFQAAVVIFRKRFTTVVISTTQYTHVPQRYIIGCLKMTHSTTFAPNSLGSLGNSCI